MDGLRMRQQSRSAARLTCEKSDSFLRRSASRAVANITSGFCQVASSSDSGMAAVMRSPSLAASPSRRQGGGKMPRNPLKTADRAGKGRPQGARFPSARPPRGSHRRSPILRVRRRYPVRSRPCRSAARSATPALCRRSAGLRTYRQRDRRTASGF